MRVSSVREEHAVAAQSRSSIASNCCQLGDARTVVATRVIGALLLYGVPSTPSALAKPLISNAVDAKPPALESA